MMQPALGVCVRVDSCLPLVYKMKFHLPLMKLFVFMSGRQPEERKKKRSPFASIVGSMNHHVAPWRWVWDDDDNAFGDSAEGFQEPGSVWIWIIPFYPKQHMGHTHTLKRASRRCSFWRGDFASAERESANTAELQKYFVFCTVLFVSFVFHIKEEWPNFTFLTQSPGSPPVALMTIITIRLMLLLMLMLCT